jgi:hypothetical protein
MKMSTYSMQVGFRRRTCVLVNIHLTDTNGIATVRINPFPDSVNVYVTGVVEMLSCVLVMDAKFQHVLRSEGTLAQAHIFLCPISVRHEGLRIGLEFPESDYFYWSLDSAGNSRMTLAECDSIGLPRLGFRFLATTKFWHEYHYNAVREFSEARGFNPHSSEVARLLGLPLVEIESEIRPSMGV